FDQPEVSGVEGFPEELSGAQQLVGLWAQPECEADLIGCVADAEQHMADMDKRLCWQHAARDDALVIRRSPCFGRARDIDLIESAQKIVVRRRDKDQAGRVSG